MGRGFLGGRGALDPHGAAQVVEVVGDDGGGRSAPLPLVPLPCEGPGKGGLADQGRPLRPRVHLWGGRKKSILVIPRHFTNTVREILSSTFVGHYENHQSDVKFVYCQMRLQVVLGVGKIKWNQRSLFHSSYSFYVTVYYLYSKYLVLHGQILH